MNLKEQMGLDPEFKSFVSSRTKKISEKTHYIYHTRIGKYSQFHGMSPSKLIEEAEKEQEDNVKPRRRKVNERIYDFINHLEEKGMSAITIRGYVETIKSFYIHCDISVKRISTPAPNKNAIFEDLITKEEIKLAVQEANTRDKAIILTHMSSGMAMNEVRKLTYGDFLKAIEKYTGKSGYIPVNDLLKIMTDEKATIGIWKLVREKTDQPFQTFTSPEATRATLDFLKYRQSRAYPISSSENILFCSSKQSGSIGQKAYVALFKRYNDKLGFGLRPNGRRRFTSHQLRKFFETEMLYAGVDKMLIDWMTAHKTNDIDASYFKIKEDKMYNQYIEALHAITLDKVEHITIEDPQVKKMREELKETKIHNQEMAEIIRQFNEFNKLPKPINP